MIIVVYYPDSTSHLAIGLTGLCRDKNLYISFFPANERSLAGFRLHELDHDRLKDSASRTSRAASVVILPTEESCGYGLSEQAVYDWWKNHFKPNQENFGWFDNNCSSVVYRALCQAQLGSASLNHALLLEKKWFCTPGSILSYASELGAAMVHQNSDEQNLLQKYAEMREICEHSKFCNPYDQAVALSSRLQQLTTDRLQPVINQFFCAAVKNVLQQFGQHLATNEQYASYSDLAAKTRTQDLSEADVAAHIQRLNVLANTIAGNPSLHDTLFPVLQSGISTMLLAPMADIIGAYLPRLLQERKLINATLQDAADKIDPKKNPHMRYVQKSDVMPQEFHHFHRAI
ncbi:hypothetical protein AQUSIP_05810 [Aquicella siphonis]|uniref:Uncharacterized protein n=1 Tax=Aquicella siphonis TaxID=254247 RepID=A0A5E4PFX6_9COXI|nr:hypothetical protein [Aquicella siphonis]VVC75293.1 hypothetical protein AQUSIP_05810 [Aquicella siphonis]